MKQGFSYKRCSRCGKLWNVSARAKKGGRYLCPDCAEHRRSRGRKKRSPSEARSVRCARQPLRRTIPFAFPELHGIQTSPLFFGHMAAVPAKGKTLYSPDNIHKGRFFL